MLNILSVFFVPVIFFAFLLRLIKGIQFAAPPYMPLFSYVLPFPPDLPPPDRTVLAAEPWFCQCSMHSLQTCFAPVTLFSLFICHRLAAKSTATMASPMLIEIQKRFVSIVFCFICIASLSLLLVCTESKIISH